MLCLYKEDFTGDFEGIFFFGSLSTIRKNHSLFPFDSFQYMKNEEFQINSNLKNKIQITNRSLKESP